MRARTSGSCSKDLSGLTKKGGEMTSDVSHVSVMRERCIELLTPAIISSENPVIVDATLGLGGHTEALLSKFPALKVIGIDRDEDALARATNRLAPFSERLRTSHACFDQISEVVTQHGFKKIDGALFDLGVSSMQLDQSERGFSYSHDAPLDMRMDRTQSLTAAEIVNTYAPGHLVKILRTYGEEKFATRVVEAIVKARSIAPLNSTEHLATLVADHMPKKEIGQDPSTRTFQALRIFVNRELEELKEVLPKILDLLKTSGIMVVISFHSLEDRIVKQFINDEKNRDTLPSNFPIRSAELPKPRLNIVTKPIRPSEKEVKHNPRSRSGIMRVAERTAY